MVLNDVTNNKKIGGQRHIKKGTVFMAYRLWLNLIHPQKEAPCMLNG